MYLFQLRKSWKMKWALEERVGQDWSNLAAAAAGAILGKEWLEGIKIKWTGKDLK